MYEPYFDRGGNPISQEEWGQLHSIHDYLVVAKTPVGPYEVSTVWLGINHAYDGGRPLIFETMIFALEVSTGTMPITGRQYAYHEDVFDYCVRYRTEQEAIDGHGAAVEMLTACMATGAPLHAEGE